MPVLSGRASSRQQGLGGAVLTRHYRTPSGLTHTIQYSHGSVEAPHKGRFNMRGEQVYSYPMVFSAWCSCRHWRYHGQEVGRRYAVKEHIALASRLVPRLTDHEWQLLGPVDAESQVQAWNAVLAVPREHQLAEWAFKDVIPVYVAGRGLRWSVATVIADCAEPCCPAPVPREERRHAEFMWGLAGEGWSRYAVPVDYLEPFEMGVAHGQS